MSLLGTEFDLPVLEYEFTYRANGSLDIPAYSGRLWHSVIGRALMEQTCENLAISEIEAQQTSDGSYVRLFKNLKPNNDPEKKSQVSIPTPHVIRVTMNQALELAKDDEFSVKILLIGDSNRFLSELVDAMHRVGINGLGFGRVKCRLASVALASSKGIDKVIYLNGALYSQPRSEPMMVPRMPKTVVLKLITPFKPSKDYAYSQQFPLAYFLMVIVRRVSLCKRFYTDNVLDVDYRQLKLLCDAVVADLSQLQRMHIPSTKCTRQKHNDVSGWVGSVCLNMQGFEVLWPLLYVGQWLNVGKNASMGFGRYKLLEFD